MVLRRSGSVPHVRIEIVKGRSLEERRRLLQAVHDALMEAFRIPDDDRTQRIVEHEPENFEIPPGSSNHYTLIEITAFPAAPPRRSGTSTGPSSRGSARSPSTRWTCQ
jgi:phenylpyruvate tautomerase PptA (4-oxalocrotonate tautomerase family)